MRCREEINKNIPFILRFHLSDITNQAQTFIILLKEFGLREFATLVGQAPLNGAKVAVEGWAFSQMPQMYSFHFSLSEKSDVQASFAQMRREFQSLEQRIGNAGTIAANVIRTWIYCRDIDNNYEGLVIARRE